MRIHFILVEPSVPENIGAAARAIKTMGFDTLRLVNPSGYPNEKAIQVAHGSREILESAPIYAALSDALSDVDFAIATSAKRRSSRHHYHHGGTLAGILESKAASINEVAVVFGREESGLTNDEIDLCDLVSFLPMKRKYPSLNLSHAVMLYAYHLSGFSSPSRKNQVSPAEGKYRRMIKLAEMLFRQEHFHEDAVYTRLFERLAMLNDHDVNLVVSVLDKLLKNREAGK
jgi:tRNA/rRNA methyltransferase